MQIDINCKNGMYTFGAHTKNKEKYQIDLH